MNIASPLSGFASASRSDPQTARFFRITFPSPDKILLKIGPGDHTVQTWVLSREDALALVRDCIPQLLR